SNSRFEQLNLYEPTLNGEVQPIEVRRTLPPQQCLRRFPYKIRFSAHHVHGAQNRSGQCRLILLRKQGQQFVSDAVPEEIASCIRDILAEGNAPVFREG